MIPPLPSTREFDSDNSLIRYYTDDGVVVCRSDGTGAVTFPFILMEPSPTSPVFAVVEWEVTTAEDDERDEESPSQYLAITTPGTDALTRLTPLTEVVDFAWAPDGRAIWFATGGSLPRELWRIDLKASQLERWRTGVSPRPSPDGRWLALLDFHPYGLYLQELPSGVARCVGVGQPVAWSSDSRYLAYTVVAGSAWQVFVYDVQQHASIHVAPNSPFSYWPSWLPNSRDLVFERCARGKAGPPSQICIASINGEDEISVSEGPWDEHPSANARTGAIVFHRRDVVDKRLTTVHLLRPGSKNQTTTLGEGREPAFLHVGGRQS